MVISQYKSYFGWDGDNEIGERLIRQIIQRTKTATCSFKVLYSEEELRELYETKGKIVTVIDSLGNPRCNIRITDIFETIFGDPDIRLVRGEGDGENVEIFKEDHRKAWENTVEGIPLSDSSVLVVELFELMETNESMSL